jgi:hypothetical protein
MFVESLFNSLLAFLARPFISPLIRAFVKPFVSPFAGFLAGSFIRRLIRRLVGRFVGLFVSLFDGHFVSALSGLLFSSFRGAARASGVYVILAMTASAIALVALLSASPVGHELDQAARLSWWF